MQFLQTKWSYLLGGTLLAVALLFGWRCKSSEIASLRARNAELRRAHEASRDSLRLIRETDSSRTYERVDTTGEDYRRQMTVRPDTGRTFGSARAEMKPRSRPSSTTKAESPDTLFVRISERAGPHRLRGLLWSHESRLGWDLTVVPGPINITARRVENDSGLLVSRVQVQGGRLSSMEAQSPSPSSLQSPYSIEAETGAAFRKSGVFPYFGIGANRSWRLSESVKFSAFGQARVPTFSSQPLEAEAGFRLTL